MKTKSINILSIALAILITSCSKNIISNHSKSNETYKNIEFKMAKIQEPVIPNYTVNLKDFGAVNGGQVLNTKAFEAAIDAVSKKEVEK